MKEGLIHEDGALIYYENGAPYHAGVICVDGDYYYISSGGRAVTGYHIVHGEMTNGLLKRGTYRFGDDYKMIKGSYIPPKSKSKFRKIKRFFRSKSGKAIVVTSILLCLCLSLALVAQKMNTPKSNSSSQTAVQNKSIQLPIFEDDVLLCSRTAKMEYDGEITLAQSIETGNPYRPFYFEYTLNDGSGKLLLSEREDFSNAREFILDAESQYVSIDNLKVDTTYYYKVLVNNETYLGNFHTAPSTRFVSIPGVPNTRDIGGTKTLDGKTIKQGILIRGCELDGLVASSSYIPEEELENVMDTFGFVYDMDLRHSNIYYGDYVSRLGIPHKFYKSPSYGEVLSPNYHKNIRQIFTALANPENYPMYLHCTWGADRTGTIVFLLQGILNVSEEDMEREYRLTGYYMPSYADNSDLDSLINDLKKHSGDTLQEQIVSFLTTVVGVTEEEIASIRQIYLD